MISNILDRPDTGTLVMPGVEVRNNKNGFRVVRLHYTADPNKATKEWKDKTRIGMPENDWEQEYEINFNILHGKRFYGEFDYSLHVGDTKANPYLDMLVSFDFGYRHPACVWAQIDDRDRVIIHREEQGEDEALINFAKRILRISNKEFPGCSFKYFADPAGKMSTDKSERTSVEILRSLGIKPMMKKTFRDLGFNIVRNLLLKKQKNPEGKELRGILVNRNCTILIDGFMGGYHYANVKEGQPDKEEATGGNFYDHLQDALRYILICLFRPNGNRIRGIRAYHRQRKTASEITGY